MVRSWALPSLLGGHLSAGRSSGRRNVLALGLSCALAACSNEELDIPIFEETPSDELLPVIGAVQSLRPQSPSKLVVDSDTVLAPTSDPVASSVRSVGEMKKAATAMVSPVSHVNKTFKAKGKSERLVLAAASSATPPPVTDIEFSKTSVIIEPVPHVTAKRDIDTTEDAGTESSELVVDHFQDCGTSTSTTTALDSDTADVNTEPDTVGGIAAGTGTDVGASFEPDTDTEFARDAGTGTADDVSPDAAETNADLTRTSESSSSSFGGSPLASEPSVQFDAVDAFTASAMEPWPDTVRIGSTGPQFDDSVVYRRTDDQPGHPGSFSLRSADGTTIWYELNEDIVPVVAFGATCNGMTDDIDSINVAARASRILKKDLVFPSGRTCAVSGYVVIENGVPRITGGELKLTAENTKGGFLLKGKESGAKENVVGLTIEDMSIDLNATARPGVYGQNVSQLSVHDVRIYNQAGGYGLLLKAFAGSGDMEDVSITDSTFEALPGDKPSGENISIGSETEYDGGLSGKDIWKRDFRLPEADAVSRRFTITGNRIYGAYYGIGARYLSNSVISGNLIEHNTRNVSLQKNSRGNEVSNNTLRDSKSASIHLAYGPEDNLVSGNSIHSSRSVGEGLLQAYLGASRNEFVNNEVILSGSAAKYHVYIGVHARDNLVKGNRLVGPAKRAYIALESGWNPEERFPSHRGGFTQVGDFANDASSGNEIRDNLLSPESAVPAIFLSQISDENGSYPLTGTIVRGNTVDNDSVSHYIYVLQHDEGGMAGTDIGENRFAGDDINKLVLLR